MAHDQRSEFERRTEGAHDNLLMDYWHFLRHSKKWWLLPFVVVLLVLGALMLVSTTAVAPFIYTLF